MLSLLLTVAGAIEGYETPAALCPPCHPEEEPESVLSVLMSLLRSVVSMLVIVFPLYKTFKAWESNRLRACRSMLAYWSAMTLLNALKDVTDEIVGKHINVTIHHLLVAAIKLAPLVLGPDAIYDATVRPFFEQHEAEMDAMVFKTTDLSNELKGKVEPTLDKVKEQVNELKEKVEARVEPTLEQIRESLREGVDTVKSSLGMDTEQPADSTTPAVPTELSPEEAVRRDEELTVEEDSSSKTGLRQRSARLDASSHMPAGVTADAESEIERAKAAKVLVEKIVWGHGLSAKNDEYQRQMKEKEVAQEDVVAGVHAVATQFNTVPSEAPGDNVTYNRTTSANTTTTTTTSTTANTTPSSTAATTSVAPPLPPRPAAPTDAITITNSTTSTTSTQPTATTAAATTIPAYQPAIYNPASASPSLAAQPATSAAVSSTKTVIDTRTAGVTSGKKILLDTRSGPNVVETYASDYHKEL